MKPYVLMPDWAECISTEKEQPYETYSCRNCLSILRYDERRTVLLQRRRFGIANLFPLIPFCTSGSSSPQTSYRTIENTLPDAEIRDGFWTPGAQAADARDDIA